MNGLDKTIYKNIFDDVPVGLFLVAPDLTVYAWNKWMASHTKITAKKAMGQSLSSLFPNHHNQRFNTALLQVLQDGHPQILSALLNNFAIPMRLYKCTYPELDMMQQHVEILALEFHKKKMALVVIQDVSDKSQLKDTLISMAARFEKSSFIDALTGLYNRRFLWKYLDTELQNAYREGHNVICCMYDLDHFKKINDELGHRAGDEVLISFCTLAKSILRPNDYLFRYGGEEFLAIYTLISIDDAIQISDRVRKSFEATQLHGSVSKTVTCSGGIAGWQASSPPFDPEKLINQADLQLYKAKELGRNCIVMNGVKIP